MKDNEKDSLPVYCTSCCQGWNKQLLELGSNYFFTLGQVGLNSFSGMQKMKKSGREQGLSS